MLITILQINNEGDRFVISAKYEQGTVSLVRDLSFYNAKIEEIEDHLKRVGQEIYQSLDTQDKLSVQKYEGTVFEYDPVTNAMAKAKV